MNKIDKIYNILIKSDYILLKTGLLILLTGFIFSTVMFPFLGHDSGYYLKYAYDIHKGLSYYTDMNIAYTPLSMYIISLLYDLYPPINLYQIFLFVVLLYFISAILIYQVLCNFKIEKAKAVLITLIMLVSLFELDGANVQLEPFVLIFQLSGVLFLQKWSINKNNSWLFVVGFFTFLAFYSKQYGISVVVGFIWYIHSLKKDKTHFYNGLMSFVSGLFLPMVLIIFYKITLQIPLNAILIKLSGIDYITRKEIITGIGYDLPHFFKSIYKFIIDLPVVLVLLAFAHQKFRPKLNPELVLVILLITGSCIQLAFAGYRHYYQLIAPFILILIALILNENEPIKKEIIHRKFIYLTTLFLLLTTPIVIDRFSRRSVRYDYQVKKSETLTKIVPSGEKVYIQAISPAYYYLCKYNSPDFLKLGYRFPEELTPKFITESLKKGDYIIVDELFIDKSDYLTNFIVIKQIELHNRRTGYFLQKN